MCCFVTLQADRYKGLEEVEDIHADVCLMKSSSPVKYILL